jgi:hypothetical protein
LPIVLWSTFSHCRIHILCPFFHNPIVPGLTRLRLQTIVMHHYQKKVVHMLLIVVRFTVLNVDDYFTLATFQMAQPTLYVAWHAVPSVGDCDVHVQILTCLDWILLEHQYVERDFPKSQFARHSAELLGVIEGLPKQPKHYHAAQWVHAYVLVCI